MVLLVMAASLTTSVQAQKADLRKLARSTTRSAIVAEPEDYSPKARLAVDGVVGVLLSACPDSLIRLGADNSTEIRFTFTYDANDNVTTLERYTAGEAGEWMKAQRISYEYHTDGRTRQETVELGIGNEWTNAARNTYGDTDDDLIVEEWINGAWQVEERQVYTPARDGKTATLEYYSGEVLLAKAEYVYNEKGDLTGETISLTGEDGVMAVYGTYAYEYGADGLLSLITLTDPAGAQLWKEEYTYAANGITTARSYDYAEGAWQPEDEKSFRIDKEDEQKVFYMQSYTYEDGQKKGLVYFESEYDVDGEERESMKYQWDEEIGEWKNHIKFEATLTPGGRVARRITSQWLDTRQEWQESIRLTNTFTTLSDGTERMDCALREVWNGLSGSYARQYVWDYYYDGISTGVTAPLSGTEFAIRPSSDGVIVSGSPASALSVKIYDMTGCVIYTNDNCTPGTDIALPARSGVYVVTARNGKETTSCLIRK